MDRHRMSGWRSQRTKMKLNRKKRLGERQEEKGKRSQMKTSDAFIIGCQVPT